MSCNLLGSSGLGESERYNSIHVINEPELRGVLLDSTGAREINEGGGG